MHSLARRRKFCESNRFGLEVSIDVTTHVFAGSLVSLRMATEETVVVEVSRQAGWTAGVEAGLKEEMDGRKPFADLNRHVD